MADKREIIPLSLERLSTDFAHLRLVRPELVDSMEKSLAQFGQLSPIVVRKGRNGFQIIDGFKRYHAATALGWADLEANVLAVNRRAATAMILTCNKNNRSLTDYEEALVLFSLKQEHNMQQEEIAALLGYSASWVSRRLALVEKLDPAVKDELKLGVLSTTQAREIVHLPRGNQQEMAKTIIDHDLNSRQTARLIDEFLKTTDREQQRYILDHPAEVLERDKENTDTDYDARLSGQGNRLLRAIKIARRQMNRLLDEAERAASNTLTGIEWIILAPELSRVVQSARELAGFIEQILEKRKS
ncbi:MAG: ParB/RepB/Spo0J family partition protein [bacterium]